MLRAAATSLLRIPIAWACRSCRVAHRERARWLSNCLLGRRDSALVSSTQIVGGREQRSSLDGHAPSIEYVRARRSALYVHRPLTAQDHPISAKAMKLERTGGGR